MYHFTDQETIAKEASNFPDLSLVLPGEEVEVKGLGQILEFAEWMHEACADNNKPEAFVLALFDVLNDNETVTRLPCWMDYRHIFFTPAGSTGSKSAACRHRCQLQ